MTTFSNTATTQGAPGMAQLPPGAIIMNQAPAANVGPRVYTNYQHKSSLVLGAIQIIVGCLCILFSIIGLAIHAAVADGGTGIWTGAWFILTGAFGVTASRSRTACPIITFMVLAIIAAVLTIPLLSTAAAGITNDKYHSRDCSFYTWYGYTCPQSDNELQARIAMNALLVALSLLEAVVAIWSSAICCGAVCCCCRSPTTQGQVLSGNQQYMIVTTTTVNGQQQTTIHQPNQGVVPQYPQQPYPQQQYPQQQYPQQQYPQQQYPQQQYPQQQYPPTSQAQQPYYPAQGGTQPVAPPAYTEAAPPYTPQTTTATTTSAADNGEKQLPYNPDYKA